MHLHISTQHPTETSTKLKKKYEGLPSETDECGKNTVISLNVSELNCNAREGITQNKKIRKKTRKQCSYSECKVRLKLTDISCRCGSKFCKKHRLPELHQCIIPLKDHAKNVDLPKCHPSKLDTI